MMGAPSSSAGVAGQQNNGDFYIAYETSSNDPNGSNHLGLVRLTNYGRSILNQSVQPALVGNPPAIVAVLGTSGDDFLVQVSYQADDPSHRLFLQSFSSTLDRTAEAVPNHTQIGGAPAITAAAGNIGAAGTGGYIVAFQANDPGNHIWFQPFAGQNSDNFLDGTAVQNNAQIGGAPAVMLWTPPSGSYAGSAVYTAGFKANDPGNHLWLGTQIAH